ncbi:MAG: CheR family methyltransferase [Thermoanaerobaculia bacterium]
MPDQECVRFLQWALPRMGFRWAGFRRVRRQVRRRLKRRLLELGLRDVGRYRGYLGEHPEEWRRLEDLCRITISRFFRDRRVFQRLGDRVLPRLAREAMARGESRLRIWSAGCGAGEEPYSLTSLRRHESAEALRRVDFEIVATDADAHQLKRARIAEYRASSLREVREEWRGEALERLGEDLYRLRASYREGVVFALQDLRQEVPSGTFDLILCRNLAFTYFAEHEQRRLLRRLRERLRPAGALVIGSHEILPVLERLRPTEEDRCIFRFPT